MSEQPGRTLWDKGEPLDVLLHRFTVGDDPHWDSFLVPWDCAASAAHAKTLERAGLLTPGESAALVAELGRIAELSERGAFRIPPELEDGHTAIESHLTQALGPAGEKIHTGRSRNDQVAVAMRLFLRDATARLIAGLQTFVAACVARAARDGDAVMPGYTHLQRAMPSSLGQWLHAFAEGASDQMRAGLHLLDRLDACPLGTGAGFGVPLPLDRAYTAGLLGFSRVQRSAIDVQNSRGRFELAFTRFASDIGGLLEKLAWDFVLFTTAEFGFFRLPASMTTGSSIMPQKRNPDALELLRGRAARLRAWAGELEHIAGKLPSSYHRDLQLTKAPAIRAASETSDLLRVAAQVIESFEADRAKMAQAVTPDMLAAAEAYERVRGGVPFRQAYRDVAAEFAQGKAFSPPTRADGSADAGQVRAALTELAIEVTKLTVMTDQAAKTQREAIARLFTRDKG
ncbi:MAG: argininosuccinate lyase [Phycisphaerae bacterium]|nr:MAG: argininosuccinate lyase [Planctomycetota bacterium]KAB2945972.1 MAG: argininosuccinate lyase [Phycisphaerae bacterium]MBE7458166.1 argininosuccinate lyase [Planctomycetia bacterium]MCK6464369.1 argininosuccinate lyase [Phycisphaerae bacterium]MCL4718080.1 argininosuccinate lyase [Phycisphaerae bacterium]